MAEIRLSKLIRQFNIGMDTLVDFLVSKGETIEHANPNLKISDKWLAELEKKFGKDLEMKEAAEKVDVKLTGILGRSASSRAASQPEGNLPEAEVASVAKEAAAKEGKEGSSKAKGQPEKPVEKPELSAEKPTASPAGKPASPAAKASPLPTAGVPKAGKDTAAAAAGHGGNAPATAQETEKRVAPQNAAAAGTAAAGETEKNAATPPTQTKLSQTNLAQTNPTAEKPTPAAPASVAQKPAAPAASASAVPTATPTAATTETAATPAATPGAGASASAGTPGASTPASGETATPQQTAPSPGTGVKVVGKIDLSKFETPRHGRKRERIKGNGSQKVDVSKIKVDSPERRDGGDRRKQQFPSGGGKNRKGDKQKQLTGAQQENLQKEIQKQVKETYARMVENKNNFGAKYRKEKREIAALRSQEALEAASAENKVLKVTEFVTVNDLATLMGNTPVVQVIGACMALGLMVSINQRLDAETLVLVAEEFGYKVEFITAELTEEIGQQEADREEDLQERPPIVTVMGHVDHGKTSLLDNIRKSNVIAGEAGGITQHIGAYNVTLPSGRRITFLDTPGHEAFTAMRARGAQMTDLAIIIIAADDAVMPQTKEAIAHAQAAGVPMVFAINKIDKPGAQPDTIRRQLSEMNLLVEDWGGKYQCQEISAKKGLNVDKLLEKVLFETDMLELKANPNKPGSGAIIESSLDKGRGYIATMLVQDGTVHTGDVILSGSCYGRIKAMFNERGQKVDSAGPSTPISMLGLNGAPAAGEKFNVLLDEREAKSIAQKREQLLRIQGIKTQKHLTLEEIGRRIAIGNFKELNVIVKGDVDGSVEALSDSLIKLSTDEVRVNVIHKAVGQISESDVLLAEASDAVIIGFQVRPSAEARRSAEKEGIEIRLYSVIYDCINEVKEGIEGMLEPEKKEEVTATVEVKQTFHISKVGTVAGCQVKEGKLVNKAQVRLIRDGIVVYTGVLASLQRGKDNAKEVPSGMECGCALDKYNDIHPGDIIEAFQITEIKRNL